MKELKKCPFCGSDAKLILSVNEVSGFAVCSFCGAKSQHLWKTSENQPTEELKKDIANLWNKRTEV